MLLVEMNERGEMVRCRLLPLDGSSPGQQIGPPNGSCTFAAWSPDGQWMYFTSDSSGSYHTWRQRFPNGQPEQITSGPTEEEGLAMAPDGRSFITAVGLTQSSVWLHDGRGDRQVSLEGYAFSPKFTPDGKRLLYEVRKGAASELWWRNSTPDAANRCCQVLPLYGQGRAPREGTTFRQMADRSSGCQRMVAGSCGCGSGNSTAARRHARFPTSRGNSRSLALPVKSSSGTLREVRRSSTVSKQTEARCGRPAICLLLQLTVNLQPAIC